jgi:hypothetical protein
MESISRFITQKLKLKVNEAKSGSGTTAGTEVPRVQLYDRPRHQAHDRAEISGTVQRWLSSSGLTLIAQARPQDD